MELLFNVLLPSFSWTSRWFPAPQTLFLTPNLNECFQNFYRALMFAVYSIYILEYDSDF